MPGKLVHTNEVTALLGDNWFAKCSAKQAQKIVSHRMKCESVFCPLWDKKKKKWQHCVILMSSLNTSLIRPAEGAAASAFLNTGD